MDRKWASVDSLSIQEVHERPQHVVRVGLHLVLGVGVERPFDLVQQRRHLPHALGDATLEAAEKPNDRVQLRTRRALRCAPVSLSV